MEELGKNKPRESSEKSYSVLKVRLMGAAFDLLEQGTDYTDIKNTMCKFGYLFNIEGRGVEALLKVTTDKTTAYFEAQGDKFIRLSLTKELFQSMVDDYLSMHGGNK